MNTIEAEDTRTDAYRFLEKVAYGHVTRLEQEFGPGLKFAPCGLARAAGIAAWLVGLRQGGLPQGDVNALADDFYGNLKYLAGYGGKIEVPDKRWVMSDPDTGNGHYADHPVSRPRYVVTLYDDATLHGFSVHWHAYVTEEQVVVEDAGSKEIYTHGHHPSASYIYSHNGGLIYHGPGRGETFTVSLTDRFWGVHT